MKFNPIKMLITTLAISKQVQAVTDSPEEGLEVAMCLTGAFASSISASRPQFIDMVNSMRDRMIAAYDEQHIQDPENTQNTQNTQNTARPAPKNRAEAEAQLFEEFEALDHSKCWNPDGSHNCKHAEAYDARFKELDKQFPRERPDIHPLIDAILKTASGLH